MPKKNTPATTTNDATRLVAYTVTEYPDRENDGQMKKRWTAIGAAFSHRDGDGWNIQLEALPINGSIVLRAPKEHDAD